MKMMWLQSVSSRRRQSGSAGGVEENQDKERRRLPKLKNPAKIWKNRKQQNRTDTAGQNRQNHRQNTVRSEPAEPQTEHRQVRTDRTSDRTPSGQNQQNHRQNTVRSEPTEPQTEHRQVRTSRTNRTTHRTPSGQNHRQNTVRSEPTEPQTEHRQVRTSRTSDRTPSGQNQQNHRQNTVRSEPTEPHTEHRQVCRHVTDVPVQVCRHVTDVPVQVCRHVTDVPVQVCRHVTDVPVQVCRHVTDVPVQVCRHVTDVPVQVCRMGKRVKEDLLTVVRTVQDCYPPQMDILNLYSGLYHQTFSTRLTELTTSGLETDDCSYLLFWINHYYPHEVLKHEELEGKIKTACLGSLLLQDQLTRLEDQYLNHKEDKVKLWLNTALRKEEESWLSGHTPELIDQYCFSPLAIDVIQVINSSLTELSCVVRDQRKAQRITAHLESFLSSYRKCVEEFVKGAHSNVCSVVKAHLVCEQQFRDYITGQTGSLSEEQRRRCLDTLSALKDCGYRCITCPIHTQMKASFSPLWTPVWLDGSLPVIDLLLDSLSQQLTDLTDLKPACRKSLLCVLHQDLVLQYVKRMMKTRTKSREQQVGGAQRMTEDAQKINDFFKQEGCSESLWLGEMLCSVAEVLRLQDPGSVQLEVVSLARTFPDLSDAHVSALLSLKGSLSAADIRSIRRSVEENRLLDVSTNQSPPFFSKVKVKWLNNKINQMALKT
ncbi:tumor necrosis factor alpha-induced protein 2a [Epinephelus moara]|uniref:tumor necrosis factor alpha-induced protein 2a n=1 Tax=Epinephelus moara TaxID=300413 RepID=UPI00214E65FC|nr:tumor necrosis factor alpha-induced protein 2a [Epinephelus moara]